jgi:hypothetical protein
MCQQEKLANAAKAPRKFGSGSPYVLVLFSFGAMFAP